MSSKEATPNSSDAAMSNSTDVGNTATEAPAKPALTKPALTAREEELFKIAVVNCLKSGVIEIDYETFLEHGKFNTLKTAQNTWGKIKAKVFPKKEDTEGGKGDATPKTPKKATTPRKRAAKTDDDDAEIAAKDDDSGSPKKKKARKTPVKKTPAKVKAEEGGDEDGDGDVAVATTAGGEDAGSPKKKGLKSPVKKAASKGPAKTEPVDKADAEGGAIEEIAYETGVGEEADPEGEEDGI